MKHTTNINTIPVFLLILMLAGAPSAGCLCIDDDECCFASSYDKNPQSMQESDHSDCDDRCNNDFCKIEVGATSHQNHNSFHFVLRLLTHQSLIHPIYFQNVLFEPPILSTTDKPTIQQFNSFLYSTKTTSLLI